MQCAGGKLGAANTGKAEERRETFDEDYEYEETMGNDEKREKNTHVTHMQQRANMFLSSVCVEKWWWNERKNDKDRN